MQEISSNDFYRVRESIGLEGLSPEPNSVILRNNPGSIYVDDTMSPKSALIWSPGIEGFYLIGDENNHSFNSELNSFIDAEIIPMMKKKGYDHFEVSSCHPSWYKTIENIFANRNMGSWNQLTYIWDKGTLKPDYTSNLKYTTRNIKDNNYDFSCLTNKEYLLNELLQYWDSIEELKEKGSCYYAVLDYKVVGLCYTGFADNERKALGIKTDEQYRRNKVGYQLASKCIDEIVEEGKTPYWDCMEENIASKLLAEKLGFQKCGEYVCYGFKIS